MSVYCPWDVVNFCADNLNKKKNRMPKNYWLNTSGNDVIKHFISSIGEKQKLTKTELEMLINGEIVQKEISEELTYEELYASIDNLWSILFMTGYLTKRGEPDGNRYNLVIPNREIRNIMTEHILTLFKHDISKDGQMVNAFCDALACGDGFSNIMIRIDDADIGIVIEVKYAQKGNEEAECKKALKQIIDKNYTQSLENAEIKTILKYGIACNIKSCKVMVQKVTLEDK